MRRWTKLIRRRPCWPAPQSFAGRARPSAHARSERAFCRIKDFRRVATRYDKLAATYTAAVSLAAIVAWWI